MRTANAMRPKARINNKAREAGIPPLDRLDVLQCR